MQLMVIAGTREDTGFNLKSLLLTPKGNISLCDVFRLTLAFSTPVTNTMCLCGLHSSLTMVWGRPTSCTTKFSLVETFLAALDVFFSFSSLQEMSKHHVTSCLALHIHLTRRSSDTPYILRISSILEHIRLQNTTFPDKTIIWTKIMSMEYILRQLYRRIYCISINSTYKL
jgi:hypothetical protein